MNDDMSGNIAVRILASIAAEADAINALIGSELKQMPVETILQMREDIVARFDEDMPIVRSTLDLIEGQLALREIGSKEQWR